MKAWLLPEYIEDILPAEALRKHVESLLTGPGHDLDLRTFKLVDQLSGRMLGVRADITPQVARIDAHLMNRKGVNRLCYAGSVLHTLPAGLNRTREPLQIGAEIYGHAGIESDLEVQRLMLDALHIAGIAQLQLDIGHVAVLRALVRRAQLEPEAEAELFRAVQAKDVPALAKRVRKCDRSLRDALLALPELTGGIEVLAQAKQRLPEYTEIRQALAQLRAIAASLRDAGTQICFDLGELRGYHYHSGVVFAVYAEGWSNALALGGRYDEVGKAFGRARPATGFSMDLRDLAQLAPAMGDAAGIRAPYAGDATLAAQIERLRGGGEVVIVELPGHEGCGAGGCDRELARVDGQWQVRKL